MSKSKIFILILALIACGIGVALLIQERSDAETYENAMRENSQGFGNTSNTLRRAQANAATTNAESRP